MSRPAETASSRLDGFDGDGEPIAAGQRGRPGTPERPLERGHRTGHGLKDHTQQRKGGLRSFSREPRKRTPPWTPDSRSFSR